MSPSNEELNSRREQAVARGVANSHPVFAVQAEGSRLTDADGHEYIDFAGGIGVMNVGHGNPRVLQAVHAQLDRFTHTCFQVVMYEDYIRLSERLNALVPGDGPRKTLLLTTGAEAVENAVKIARSATGRPAVIAFTGSFHGRTLLGMTLTGKVSPYRQDFGPYAPEVYHAPYPYEYRGWTAERALAAFDELLETEVNPEAVAAVVIEPVLGEGGFVPAPAEYLRELRRRTQAKGILLIADEIQTGFGRTGRMLAIEHSGVVPDLVTLAKSMAGGLPVSAVVGRADVMDAPGPGGLGGTYAGNPLACAAANAVLDVFEQGDLLARAEHVGRLLRQGLQELQARHAAVGDVRGLGPMMAMELVRERETREPDAALTGKMLESAREQGLLLVRAGLHGNVVRALAPLTIDDAEVARALEILDAALSGVPAAAA